MKNYTHDVFSMANAVDSKTKAVFIANPNNPTGTYVTTSELLHFIGNVPRYMLIVLDEAYYEYVTESDYPDTLDLLRKHDNILILRTFSKMYGLAGLRIGYAIGSPKVISDLHKTKEPFNVNAVAQVAALGALGDHEFVEKSQKSNMAGKVYLYDEFDKMNLQYWKSAANFIFLRIGMDAQVAFKTLMERGITIRPMSVLGYTDGIRITIGTREQNELFIKLLKDLLGK